MKYIFIATGILTIGLLVAAVVLLVILRRPTTKKEIFSFEDCSKTGYPILPTYPRRCKTPDGRIFREELAPKVKEEKKEEEDFDQDLPEPIESKLGIGFILGKETLEFASALTFEDDFVDIMVGPGTVNLIKEIESLPVKISCVFRSLRQMEETISFVQEGGVRCDYLAYNPEQTEKTPQEELNDLVGSVKRVQETARNYGASVVTGPGMGYMLTREELYPQAASYSDVWLLQSQRFQIDKETGRRASPEEYQAQVARIVNLLRQGNPNIKVWVQIIIAPGEREENTFSAEEIVALAKSIEDLVDAVRIYIGSNPQRTSILRQVIEPLRG